MALPPVGKENRGSGYSEITGLPHQKKTPKWWTNSVFAFKDVPILLQRLFILKKHRSQFAHCLFSFSSQVVRAHFMLHLCVIPVSELLKF